MSAAASTSLPGPALTAPPLAENSLSPADRFRLSLLGFVIALALLALVAGLGVLLSSALFGYPSGGLV